MRSESYYIELEIKGLLSNTRIYSLFEIDNQEIFLSDRDVIIKGTLPDQSSMTSFMKRVRDSGLEIIKVRCQKIDI